MRKRVSVVSVVILSLAIPVYLLNTDNQNEISTSSVVVEKAEMPMGEMIPVERVIDGDTIKIMYEGKSVSVRIIGINTPETKHPEKPIECFGPEASNFAEELMSNKEILLELDESQGKYDKYDRLLAYIWLPNGQLYSEVAIENGLDAMSFKGFDIQPEADYLKSRKTLFVNSGLHIGLAAPMESTSSF
jgi:micrococcal nuclease